MAITHEIEITGIDDNGKIRYNLIRMENGEPTIVPPVLKPIVTNNMSEQDREALEDFNTMEHMKEDLINNLINNQIAPGADDAEKARMAHTQAIMRELLTKRQKELEQIKTAAEQDIQRQASGLETQWLADLYSNKAQNPDFRKGDDVQLSDIVHKSHKKEALSESEQAFYDKHKADYEIKYNKLYQDKIDTADKELGDIAQKMNQLPQDAQKLNSNPYQAKPDPKAELPPVVTGALMHLSKRDMVNEYRNARASGSGKKRRIITFLKRVTEQNENRVIQVHNIQQKINAINPKDDPAKIIKQLDDLNATLKETMEEISKETKRLGKSSLGEICEAMSKQLSEIRPEVDKAAIVQGILSDNKGKKFAEQLLNEEEGPKKSGPSSRGR